MNLRGDAADDATCRKAICCGAGRGGDTRTWLWLRCSAPWGSTPFSFSLPRRLRAPLRASPPPPPPQFQLRKRPVRTDTLSVQTAGLRLHLSPWVSRLQTASFSPPYSPTARSPPTDCRRTSASGTGAPCRMRCPERDASRNRSRWDWRKSPHFRVRMARPRTTPCQVNISKRVHAPPGVDPQPTPSARCVSVVSREKGKGAGGSGRAGAQGGAAEVEA